MADPTLASSTDINEWANHLDARGELPKLIRCLIAATSKGLTALSMPADEGVDLPGWDGITQTDEVDPHVPFGTAVWEMGNDKDPRQKANKELEKRSKDSGQFDPTETTFVFVTPRRWKNKRNWLSEQLQQGKRGWREIRAYDAEDLACWLERAPAVRLWFSEHIGKNPGRVRSLEAWWNAWSHNTDPAIPPALLLSGRDSEAEQICSLLQGEGSRSLVSDSRDEAIAFVAAVLKNYDEKWLDRAVVVWNSEEWRQLAQAEDSLVLLPCFEVTEIALAVRSGHTVIVPLGPEKRTGSKLELRRLRRQGIEEALMNAGMPRERASKLATLGRRSLLSLRRTLAREPSLHTPEWSQSNIAREVLVAVLLEQWRDSKEGDRDAIAKLAEQPYQTVAEKLTTWLNTSDPPIRQVGDVWFIASKYDAWCLTKQYLTSGELELFRQVALEVVGGDDPALELPPEQQMMAPIVGKTRPQSNNLIGGIADTLALMGAEESWGTSNRDLQDEAASVVRELLHAANQDTSGRHWIALSNYLPALAEAAPDVFLETVAAGLRDDRPLSAVFQDGGKTPPTLGNSAHTGLLWALETLAWSQAHFTRVVLLLANLAQIDPGGQLANRPMRSLHKLLVLWCPTTGVPLNHRLEALEALRQQDRNLAWKLMLKLIPTPHETILPPRGPTWRNWGPENSEQITAAECHRGIETVSQYLLKDAGQDAHRWVYLVQRLLQFPPQFRDQIVNSLQRLDLTGLSLEKCRAITDAIQSLILDCRSYSNAWWALPEAELEQLNECCERLLPSDPQHRHRWLFTREALQYFRRGSSRKISVDEAVRAHSEAQANAVGTVYDSEGLDAIWYWSKQFGAAGAPYEIGKALARLELQDGDEEQILQALGSDSEHHDGVARGYIRCKALLVADQRSCTDWAADALEQFSSKSPARMADFLSLLPAIPEIWELAERADSEVEREYWHRFPNESLVQGEDACAEAARKLIGHGRPHVAVRLLDNHAREFAEGPPSELVAEALEEAFSKEPAESLDEHFVYCVEQHLDRLAERSFDEKRLARLEFTSLPLWELRTNRALVLHRALASNPEFFVEVVTWIYGTDGEDMPEPSESDITKARCAFELLNNWRKVPGEREDGILDEEHLKAWIGRARHLLFQAKCLEVGDRHIGRVLRYGPGPDEGGWPCRVIRDVIESTESEALESGFCQEVHNSRGVTVRDPTEGGEQERVLVEQYRHYADLAATKWPRTSAMLRGVAHTFEQEARNHDQSAILTEDSMT